MMGKLVVMRFIRKDYHYVLVNSVRGDVNSPANAGWSYGREAN